MLLKKNLCKNPTMKKRKESFHFDTKIYDKRKEYIGHLSFYPMNGDQGK